MNRNLIIGIIVVLIAVGGFLLVQSQSKTIAPTKTSEEQSQSDEAGEDAEESGGNEISLTKNGFEPSSITIKAGEKVEWENESGEAATVDSVDHPTHLVYPVLNLGELADGESHELVFDKAGTYGYHDHLHPERTGTVVVE